MRGKEPSLSDRLSTSAKARQAQRERTLAQAPAASPGFAERQAARRAVGVAREARAAERQALKLSEAEREAAEAAQRAIALKAEQAADEAAIAEQAVRAIAVEAERKTARDARYAARKARQRR
jgi:hypothetical protein